MDTKLNKLILIIGTFSSLSTFVACTGEVISPPKSTPASTPASMPASTPASMPASIPASMPASIPASTPASTTSSHILGPNILRIVPESGEAGTPIRIEGEWFHSNATVSIGGSPCHVTAATNVQILCTVSAGAPGPHPVRVTVPDGRNSLPLVFRVLPHKHDLAANARYAELVREEGLHRFSAYRSAFDSANTILTNYELHPPAVGLYTFTDSTGHQHRYRVNYRQISQDPFLHTHNSDPNSLYPDLSHTDLVTLSNRLIAAGMLQPEYLRRAQLQYFGSDGSRRQDMEDGVKWNLNLGHRVAMGLDHANPRMQQAIFKRIKRLADAAENDDELGTLAIALGNNMAGNRCIDGVQDSLVILERDRLGGLVVLPPETFGQMMSRVFTDYKESFIQKHEQLFLGVTVDSEPRTDGIGLLRGRMTYALGTRGDAPILSIPVFSLRLDARLNSDAVMRRFVVGESLQPYSNVINTVHGGGDSRLLGLDTHAAPIVFEAYNVPLMLRLLKEARMKGFTRPPRGTPGLPNRFGGKPLMDEQVYRDANRFSFEGFRLKHDVQTNLIDDEYVQTPSGKFSLLWDDHNPNSLLQSGFYIDALLMGDATYSNAFFKAADVQTPAPEAVLPSPNVAVGDTRNFYLGDEAWLYLLKKYNYIIEVPIP